MTDSAVDQSKNPGSTRNNMNLAQARAVMWLRNNYRPMGELFDEGYLDLRRLEWAIEKAYVQEIRQAAQILLESGKREQVRVESPQDLSDMPFAVNITLEQARATLWPFGTLKGQSMGALLDSQQLNLKDLGYAVEHARDPRTRESATVLMLVRLKQQVQESDGYSLINIASAGRSFSEIRQLSYFALYGLALGVIIGLAVAILVWEITRERPAPTLTISDAFSNPLYFSAFIVALLIYIGVPLVSFWLLNKFVSRRFDNAIRNLAKGKEGEDNVVSVISQVLDKHWYLFRNLRLSGIQGGDLDIVLVGPSGVWVLEVKTLNGKYRNIGDHWEYRSKKRWSLMRKSPSRQVQKNATALARWLHADGIHKWIKPAIVWANPDSLESVENPTVPVWKLDRLPDELGNIWQGSALSEQHLTRIVEKLTKLAERNRQGDDE